MRAWGLLAAATIVASALATVKGQQSQPYSGMGDYQVYCSSCHGTDARGEGVIAKTLKKKPSDLTQLSTHNDGKFPEEKVFKSIDGKQGGHSDDMPAWADIFAKASESAGADNAKVRIETLVKYIESLQAK